MNCTCPGCHSTNIHTFYHHAAAPVHSVLVHHTREEAQQLTTGQISLGFCETCGFIFNDTFDPNLQDYSLEYESTQGYSPTFNAFAHKLAQHLIDRYDLHGKDIIEIGCGQGEFLQSLCELGGNRGLGFDPAYVAGRLDIRPDQQLAFIKDYYSEQYAHHCADFIVCKMTLEHIRPVADFVSTVRRSIGNHLDTVVFFQIPDANRVLEEVAFWDVYYEHCSYFSMGSLARLFRACGFNVLDLWRGYGDQYLMIEARPAGDAVLPPLPAEDDLEKTREQVYQFAQRAPQAIHTWQQRLKNYQQAGKQVALWGGGSKAVAFLTTLGITDEVACAVDINPFKHGSFLAGTGTPVSSPETLRDLQPDVVILMNPIYKDEIQRQLAEMKLTPTILTVND